MARIVFNPALAGQSTLGLRSHNRGITLPRTTSSFFSRSVWFPFCSTPFYSQRVYHYSDRETSWRELFIATAAVAAIIGAAVYFSPTDCIEQCVYNWEGVGVCECIQNIY